MKLTIHIEYEGVESRDAARDLVNGVMPAVYNARVERTPDGWTWETDEEDD